MRWNHCGSTGERGGGRGGGGGGGGGGGVFFFCGLEEHTMEQNPAQHFKCPD